MSMPVRFYNPGDSTEAHEIVMTEARVAWKRMEWTALKHTVSHVGESTYWKNPGTATSTT